MNELLTSKELEKIFKVDRTTIWRWRKQGMPYEKIGGSIRFNLEKVEKWFSGSEK